MKGKYNEATSQRPKGDRPLDAPMVTIDLSEFIRQLKEEESWKDSDRNAITVYHTDGLRLVLIALHEGAEMKRHKSDGIISVQVIEGRLKFTTDMQSVELSKGKVVTLHKAILHDVRALEDTTFLLTMAIEAKERY